MELVRYFSLLLLLIVSIIYIWKYKKEGMADVSLSAEAVQNIASVYNKDNLTTTNITTTGKITSNNGINLTKGGICRDIDCGVTGDLGLYSNKDGQWTRFVNRNGQFNFYSDGGNGNSPTVSIDKSGNLSTTGTISGPMINSNNGIQLNNKAVIIRGGDPKDIVTNDLGLYSNVENNNVRFVSRNGNFIYFSDGATGGKMIHSIDKDGNTRIFGNLIVDGNIIFTKEPKTGGRIYMNPSGNASGVNFRMRDNGVASMCMFNDDTQGVCGN